MLTKEQLFAMPDPIRVRTPSGDVYVRTLTGAEYMQMLKQVRENELDASAAAALMLELCVCDAEGNRLLDDGEGAGLASAPGSVFTALLSSAQTANGIVDEGN